MVTLKRRKFFRYSRIIVIERRIFFYGEDTEKIIFDKIKNLEGN